MYKALSRFYDILNRDIDYSRWADFVLMAAEKHSYRPKTALDLACGTGSMTIELARRGIDMTGADISPEMLNVARERAEKEGLLSQILFLCQDMREFELYGTVNLITCCLDSLNHLDTEEDLYKVFSLVNNYLDIGGTFIFDIHSKYKFENVYGDNSYILEDNGVLCAWENRYHPRKKRVDFFLSLFSLEKDGRYIREDAEGSEYYFPEKTVIALIEKAGMEVCSIYGDIGLSPANEESERLYFVCRTKKNV